MSKIVTILVIVFLVYGLYWLWKKISIFLFGGRGKSAQAPRHLKRRLLILLNGDEATANRLIQHAKIKYPGHSETWYWEKVIFDLEHDRGR